MIQLKDVDYSVGDFKIKRVSLIIGGGDYFVLLGPAGSGKSVLLESICGIRSVDSGRIFIDGKDVTDIEPRLRNVGYVPQDYVLFKHLSVADNIGFALKIMGQSTSQRARQVGRVAEMLAIDHLLGRGVHGLSGGQQQLVALARALVAEPSVLLLDEPVCAIDEGRRQEICALLGMIAKDLKLTVVHVNHNIEESFSVADSAAVMRAGVIEQFGEFKDLLRRPENEFVARFMRCENIYSCVTTEAKFPGGTEVKFGSQRLVLPGSLNPNVNFMIRPENIELFDYYSDWQEDENIVPVKVVGWRDFGGYIRVELDGPPKIFAHVTHDKFAHLSIPGKTKLLAWLNRDNIHVLEDEKKLMI